MNIKDLFNLFLLVSAIHGFVFCFILFFSKNRKNKFIIYLNLLVLSISLNNFQSWFLENNLFKYKFFVEYIQIPWHFLMAPLFYTALIHYLNIADRSIKIIKYILPIFLFAIICQVHFVLEQNNATSISELSYLYERYTSIEEIISFVISITVFIYSFFILYKKEKLFSKILSFDNLQWIYSFFKLGAVTYLFWVIALIVKVSMNYSGFLFSYYPLRIATTLIIYRLGYQGFIQLRLLKEREEIRDFLIIENSTHTANLEKLKKEKSILKNNESEKQDEKFTEIDEHIKKNKKFLLPKYTLQNLSEELTLSSSTLSSIINNCAKKSFVDYINEMRVKQAKRLLVNPKYSEYTITSIGLESGFNSKSSFYAVFKKHVGCTPVVFKSSSL